MSYQFPSNEPLPAPPSDCFTVLDGRVHPANTRTGKTLCGKPITGITLPYSTDTVLDISDGKHGRICPECRQITLFFTMPGHAAPS